MLTHKGTQNIKTERLYLRRFTINDAQDMFNNWANDERVTHFLSWTPHGSIDVTRQILSYWITAYDNPCTYNWAIEFDGEVIGSIGTLSFNERCEHAEIGYCIGHDYWIKCIMTESQRRL